MSFVTHPDYLQSKEPSRLTSLCSNISCNCAKKNLDYSSRQWTPGGDREQDEAGLLARRVQSRRRKPASALVRAWTRIFVYHLPSYRKNTGEHISINKCM